MSETSCTDNELAETRERIIQVCMERHVASGVTEAEARAIVEEAMNAPNRNRFAMTNELDASDDR
jgi:hypothetical protein